MGGGFRVALGSGISAEGGGAEAAAGGPVRARAVVGCRQGARWRMGGLGQPVVASGPVAFERPMWVTSFGGDPFGPALCSDAVWSRVPVAPGYGGRGLKLRV